MTHPLPTLTEQQITINVAASAATASLQFTDGHLVHVQIAWETLRAWAIASRAYEIKAAILEHYGLLAGLAGQARASGKSSVAI